MYLFILFILFCLLLLITKSKSPTLVKLKSNDSVSHNGNTVVYILVINVYVYYSVYMQIVQIVVCRKGKITLS